MFVLIWICVCTYMDKNSVQKYLKTPKQTNELPKKVIPHTPKRTNTDHIPRIAQAPRKLPMPHPICDGRRTGHHPYNKKTE